MKILLAPMEGVIDHHMREVLTRVGGYDACVTEFLRITDQRLPAKVFWRLSPELHASGHTASGVPVVFQLLGGDPEMMAANAQKAAELGAPGIDINFGCPSKFVTRKMGGSVLLREPERVHEIVTAVRGAVDREIPVTAKMRLGYEDDVLALENALAIEGAGACELTVHARTKLEGYTPPARWEALAPLRDALSIPLIANGDIRILDDYRRCVDVSGCKDVMLGRGALGNPFLASQIKQSGSVTKPEPIRWEAIQSLIINSVQSMELEYREKYVVMRVKQWLGMIRKDRSEAAELFDKIRQLRALSEIKALLSSSAVL